MKIAIVVLAALIWPYSLGGYVRFVVWLFMKGWGPMTKKMPAEAQVVFNGDGGAKVTILFNDLEKAMKLARSGEHEISVGSLKFHAGQRTPTAS